MKAFGTLILFSFLFLQFLEAQPHIHWHNFTYSQRVTDIVLQGNYVWITTQGGLVKYNKLTGAKVFLNRANSNLPDNNLLCITLNNNEIFLGGKYYGIGKYSGNACVNYGIENSGLPSNQYNSRIKLDAKGNLWIASFRWMTRYNGTSWKTWETGDDFSAFPIISDFLIDSLGTVWICSSDGLGKIENEEYSIIGGIPGISNLSMTFDSLNNIWIGADGYGLYRYDGTAFTILNELRFAKKSSLN